jgi:hypothetical protein
VQAVLNIPKLELKRSEIQGGVRTEITELPPVTTPSARPNPRLSDAITNAIRTQ